ncbi:riboflavin kinase [Mameliella sediminis]|uniref:riboflavin kinase n=1 Tax=Mameliella sediminis TaxID=2836866 RepID=UPI001C49416E|nr:riboflavin kinase [Mameliella sediminis]MBV7392658.1 riboflavin kinase [Mameliella sediminis]
MNAAPPVDDMRHAPTRIEKAKPLQRITGTVVHGLKNGRKFGFPTANLVLPSEAGLAHGIYVARVAVLEGPDMGLYDGCASIGTRPTIGSFAANFEVHLLDFTGDLYGRRLAVDLVKFLRTEVKFQSIDALIRQIDADVLNARRVLRRISANITDATRPHPTTPPPGTGKPAPTGGPHPL